MLMQTDRRLVDFAMWYVQCCNTCVQSSCVVCDHPLGAICFSLASASGTHAARIQAAQWLRRHAGRRWQ